MTVVDRQANELRAIAERLRSTSEQSRSTFTDESRPKFDDHVIEGMRKEIRALAVRVSELDVALDSTLRLLD